ncbi:DNA-binding protein [Streptomyces sp. TRM43335]|uniref:DNA-binding protein n=1 Tax=Streptomyces taklimakanensis TaxID=2569853 RepID=A0A6G2B9Q4_9ACTN|nr:TraR/DksA C4-type zinc finger protein [Streptomyces taklimakanensis]MTE18632.1 DNA-binding protein [Streptomyces taklimakanensis]
MVAGETAGEKAEAVRKSAAKAAGGIAGKAARAAGEPRTAEGARAAGGKKEAAGDASAGNAGRNAAREPSAGKAADRKTGAKTVVAKKSTTGAQAAEQAAAPVPPARAAAVPAAPDELLVRPGEDPWTAQEVEEARAGLSQEAERLRVEIHTAEEALNGLMRDSADGAGDDQADTGTKNITREHEMALAENAREMLYQTERALDRLEAGTYGACENCGRPIGKARMQAFPRATLCVECKQRQERR